jgi:hypothetical protein
MKITIVSRPKPNEAVVQLQKNSIIGKIEAIEKNPDYKSKSKIQILKQRMNDIEKRYEEQVQKEKNELAQKYRQLQETKKTDEKTGMLDAAKDNDKDEHILMENKDEGTESLTDHVSDSLGVQLDKRV